MLFGKKYVKTLFFYNANPFRYARNNFTKFFSKWKSSLKINQMYLYVFLLSNYLDSFFPKRMFGNDHHRHSQKISYRDFRTNRQQATKKWNWSAQKMLLHAVCRSQVFQQCEKKETFTLTWQIFREIGRWYNLVLIPLIWRNFREKWMRVIFCNFHTVFFLILNLHLGFSN